MKNKFTLLALLAMMAVTANAQINIGSTVAPNDGAILDASNTSAASTKYKGIYLPQVALTSSVTYGLNTVNNPASVTGGMMVYNTATAGSGTTAVIPGLYIWQNSVWNLVNISVTKNTAATLPIVTGTLSYYGITLDATNWNKMNYSGGSITLPANSKYIVNANILLHGTVGLNTWIRSGFCDTDNSSNASYVSTTDVSGASLISGNFLTGAHYSLMQGTIFLQNNSNSPKKYYYWVGSVDYKGTPTNGDNITNIGSNQATENVIYAIPIN